MAGRVADLLEVVVLAAGAHALLAGDSSVVVAPFQSLKHALELHHAGIGEQQRGVVLGDQGAARHLGVPTRCEVLDEFASDIGGLHCGEYSAGWCK